jgi:hypothetical protein
MISKRGLLTALIASTSGLLARNLIKEPERLSAQALGSPALIGSWIISNVTPQGLLTRSLFSFHSDGTLTQTSVSHLTQGPGHGVWKQVADRTYEATFWLLEFGSNGAHINTIKRRSRIELDPTMNQAEIVIYADRFDLSGNPVGDPLITPQQARRIAPEPYPGAAPSASQPTALFGVTLPK